MSLGQNCTPVAAIAFPCTATANTSVAKFGLPACLVVKSGCALARLKLYMLSEHPFEQLPACHESRMHGVGVCYEQVGLLLSNQAQPVQVLLHRLARFCLCFPAWPAVYAELTACVTFKQDLCVIIDTFSVKSCCGAHQSMVLTPGSIASPQQTSHAFQLWATSLQGRTVLHSTTRLLGQQPDRLANCSSITHHLFVYTCTAAAQ